MLYRIQFTTTKLQNLAISARNFNLEQPTDADVFQNLELIPINLFQCHLEPRILRESLIIFQIVIRGQRVDWRNPLFQVRLQISLKVDPRPAQKRFDGFYAEVHRVGDLLV